MDGWQLDGRALKAADNREHGLPGEFKPHLMYGYRLNESGELVLIPVGLRRRAPVSFRGLDAYGIGKAAA